MTPSSTSHSAGRLPVRSDRPLRVGLILGADAMTQAQLTAHQARGLDDFQNRRLSGNSDVGKVLQIVDRSMIETSYLIVTRNYLRQRRRDNLNHCDVLFNAISDPDVNPESLRVVGRLMKQTDRPWINDPRNVLKTTRDRVANRLASVDGLYVPKIARISSFTRQAVAKALQEFDFDFPVLVRKAGTHTGQTLQLLTSLDEVPETNSKKGDWFVTEFIDFKSSDGIYRKYRAFIIGHNIILRHVYTSDYWNVHRSSTKNDKLNKATEINETYELLTNRLNETYNLRDILMKVKNKIDMDYFGIDFGLYQDFIVLFEANATMNQLPIERYAPNVAIADVISAMVDLVCQKGFAVKPAHRLRNLSPSSFGSSRSREAATDKKSTGLPELPIKVAVLTGADTVAEPIAFENGAIYLGFQGYKTILQNIRRYIDPNSITFSIQDLNNDFDECLGQLKSSNADVVINLTSAPDHNPETFEKLSELNREMDLKWINCPDVIASLAGDVSSEFSKDGQILIWPVDDSGDPGGNTSTDYRSPDGLYRKYRLLFIGTEASVVDFFVSQDSRDDPASSGELIRNDPTLRREERDALIGNSMPDDGEFLTGLRELRAAVKADIFGVDCVQLPDGRLAVLRPDPAMLHLPFGKYRGLPAWRPASALHRLIHKRAAGLI